jgi:choline-sulfatase
VPPKYRDLYAGVSFDSVHWEPAAANATAPKAVLQNMVASIRKAAASVTALDDQIQPLIDKLDQRGLRDETLIVFTGTCGALLGRHGLWGNGDASDPPNMYDEAINVPLIWQWQGRTPPEAVRPELVSSYDLFSSLCAVTRAYPDTNGLAYPGRSYLPAAVNYPFPKKHPWINRCFAEYGRTRMVRDKVFKLVLREGGPDELYDTVRDPGEKANHYPAAEFLTVRNALTKALDAWSKEF